ncbi:hypothetical protein [Paenibacillus alginolyticus]|uniref:ApeA N-terminal domain-containing protein n=1 Tax=Paenibacillus alginolyticus TaxID=59839 RepID=A0ABT4GF04_9BACL|nr:hypothetical protein [Paenibacillus alginolyticus]MCY9694771.1 hypothetical protein [Paenibacillus alginolyticus]MEC0147057.1 hypothetical protein [Paenibacillus alginolyticus]
MKYPVYIIKDYQDESETIYKYTNFNGRNIGMVRINLDTEQIVEVTTLPTEESEGTVYQQVSCKLLSNIQKHIMFFLESKTTNSAIYLVLDHHENALGKIRIEDHGDIHLDGIDRCFIEDQVKIIKLKGFPASHFTRMKIEFKIDSLYILQTLIYRENVEYIYINDYDTSLFGRLSINRLNGQIKEVGTSINQEDGLYELVAERIYACFKESIYHDVIELHERRKLIQLSNVEINDTILPCPNDSWSEISYFALTFNGYGFRGSFDEVAKVATNVEKNYSTNKNFNMNTLTDLRTNLFIIQRGCNHRGEPPTGELLEYVYALIEGIRTKINENQF